MRKNILLFCFMMIVSCKSKAIKGNGNYYTADIAPADVERKITWKDTLIDNYMMSGLNKSLKNNTNDFFGYSIERENFENKTYIKVEFSQLEQENIFKRLGLIYIDSISRKSI